MAGNRSRIVDPGGTGRPYGSRRSTAGAGATPPPPRPTRGCMRDRDVPVTLHGHERLAPVRGRRAVAAVTGTVLALPVAAAPPGSPAVARTARPATATFADPAAPCPTPAVPRSPRPSPAAAESADREIGGAALATPGLVVPPDAKRP